MRGADGPANLKSKYLKGNSHFAEINKQTNKFMIMKFLKIKKADSVHIIQSLSTVNNVCI